MAKLTKGPSKTIVTIIVATVIVISVFVCAAVACSLVRRHKRNKRNAQVLKAHLRGGGDEEHEIVEFMKSGSFEAMRHERLGLADSNKTQPSELGYTTRPWHELPRTLLPGQANTALPTYRPTMADLPKAELADTSIVELPPAKSDQKLVPTPLNFSRPSRDNARLKCDGEIHELSEEPQQGSIPTIAGMERHDPNRISSPTVPNLIRHEEDSSESGIEERSSPVSPLTVGNSVRGEKDRPRRVSFASDVSHLRPMEMQGVPSPT